MIGVPDEEFGSRLRAYVVRTQGAGMDEAAVRAHVRDNLARFKVPRDVAFLEELPRTPSGKVLRRELADDELGRRIDVLDQPGLGVQVR